MKISGGVLALNYEKTTKHLIKEIKSEFKCRNAKRAVIGISGGLDSSIVLTLLAMSLGKSKIVPVFMPYRTTSKTSAEDAHLVCAHLSLNYEVKNITKQIDAYFKEEKNPGKNRIGNKCARERMSILYDISMRENGIVFGTSNRSEIVMGYGTIFGDLACAVNPIGSLYKTKLFKYAEYLCIPKRIIEKKPSADLWEGQTDEGDLGLSYKTIDEISYLYFDKKKSLSDVKKQGYREKDVRRVISSFERNAFKRELPLIINL